MPHCTSSEMNSQPCFWQISYSPRRCSRRVTLMPPSPWIGSIMMAAVFLLCSAIWRTASRSLSGTRTKPCTSGSKPACTLRLPVADSVASERPWNAFSITMMAGSGVPFLWPYFGDAFVVAVLARHLDRGLGCFESRVAEEDFVEARDLGDAIGGSLLIGDAEQ